MHNSVDYLNLEYFLVKLQDVALSVHSASFSIPAFAGTLVTYIFILGMFASLVFLILAVYAQIRLLQTEHAGFHTMEAHVHEHHDAEVESTGKNERWEHIVKLASSGNQSDWRRAILEADIMLSDVLKTQGYAGAGVGEQLKMANPIQMTTLDLAWKAHKVRNEIAHGGESYALTERDTRTAIDYYKRVFEELGAI